MRNELNRKLGREESPRMVDLPTEGNVSPDVQETAVVSEAYPPLSILTRQPIPRAEFEAYLERVLPKKQVVLPTMVNKSGVTAGRMVALPEGVKTK